MPGETSLSLLLKTMEPRLNAGEYVFCTVIDAHAIHSTDILCFLREDEGITLVLEKNAADRYKLAYSLISSWITLTVHSALEVVGLTAAFSQALSAQGVSCNVIAGYYHDHIFVPVSAAEKAMGILHSLSGH